MTYKPHSISPDRMTYKPHFLSPERTFPKIVKESVEISEIYLLSLLKKHLLNYSQDDRGNVSFMKFFSAVKDARHSTPIRSSAPRSTMEIDSLP